MFCTCWSKEWRVFQEGQIEKIEHGDDSDAGDDGILQLSTAVHTGIYSKAVKLIMIQFASQY